MLRAADQTLVIGEIAFAKCTTLRHFAQSNLNMIAADYDKVDCLKMDMRAACLNLIQFGDVGLLKVRNGFGQVVKLITLSSLYLRKTKGNYRYWCVNRSRMQNNPIFLLISTRYYFY